MFFGMKIKNPKSVFGGRYRKSDFFLIFSLFPMEKNQCSPVDQSKADQSGPHQKPRPHYTSHILTLRALSSSDDPPLVTFVGILRADTYHHTRCLFRAQLCIPDLRGGI